MTDADMRALLEARTAYYEMLLAIDERYGTRNAEAYMAMWQTVPEERVK